ncbi:MULTISPECIES: 4,5-DOPA dioxygenase extradiol [Leptospira]|uniref:Aromatic ring-opening dioxygenase, catalytic subunit LigB n=3 Tax=Leptospira TaxID=171 RepID=A0AAV3JB59_LEPBO|nr:MULTISPECIES: 4,5-DOPA dioxygenase extradiol [Leptospira]AXX14490.1 4,5-DOPA dioxygenase extradiol [Leptospira borgpetersenii serovar Ceylonica]EKQ91871.1 aromatic ring-opening dioxygenase, catalytic subunit LigB [Leptospira borgpetersenii str. UI 09149]EMK12230.1 aromatic ring-opening dioxygenase, catalytic subunit LigB [Leptospira sp. serovar Kenya str. Sh9]EMN13962.1 aromatic ring-opening dioxygenase, catalytic subunit LigB [Leptospira borgpetersenii str. Brem 307]EMN15968.1 aromatic rin
MTNPVLFFGHGSPMNLVTPSDFTRNLKEFGATLQAVKNILVVSAHWKTRGTYVTTSDPPKQIYDFYGFPPELYEIQYRPSGSPELAEKIQNSLKTVNAQPTQEWGLDHGSWGVLCFLFQKANIPVLQLSLDTNLSPEKQYEIGKELRPLREEGTLILGSGNIVHNLQKADFYDMNATPTDWAIEFDEFIRQMLESRNDKEILDFQKKGDIATFSVPTTEHLEPIFYVLGAMKPEEKVKFIHHSFQNRTVSMRSFTSI